MMAWRPDPFLLRFLEAVERDLAWALELHHRLRNAGPLEARVLGDKSQTISTLRRTVDALQVALERPSDPILH